MCSISRFKNTYSTMSPSCGTYFERSISASYLSPSSHDLSISSANMGDTQPPTFRAFFLDFLLPLPRFGSSSASPSSSSKGFSPMCPGRPDAMAAAKPSHSVFTFCFESGETMSLLDKFVAGPSTDSSSPRFRLPRRGGAVSRGDLSNKITLRFWTAS